MPPPGRAASERSPPCCRASARAMVSPRPDPRGFVVAPGEKSASPIDGSTPRPRSRTRTRAAPSAPRATSSSTRRAGGARVERVLHEVDEDLLHLARIAARRETPPARTTIATSPLARHPLVQRGDLAAERAELDVAERERHERAREVQELVEDRLHPVDLAPEHVEPLGGLPLAQAGREERREPLHARERVLQLVRDLGGERGELLRALRRAPRATPAARRARGQIIRSKDQRIARPAPLEKRNTSESIAACV